MNNDKKRIITISREFGSGGRLIGGRLAEKLGVPYYDKELLDKIAEETADVTIMLEQLRLIFGLNDMVCEAMDEKVERLAVQRLCLKDWEEWKNG